MKRINWEKLNNNENIKKSLKTQSHNLRNLVVASVFAIGGYYTYDLYQEKKDKDTAIPMIPYEGDHLTKVSIDVKDWQNYSRQVLGILFDGQDAEEEKLYIDFFLALIAKESSYDSQAKSPTWATGLTQITNIVFKDFLQKHRKEKYISRLLMIRDTQPKLINRLPKPLLEAIMNLSENPSDEEVARLVGIFQFFIKKSADIDWAKIDPHTSILLGAILYDMLYDQWRANPENVEEVFAKIQENTKNTKYELSTKYNYGPKLKYIIYALYRYNGDKMETDASGVTAQDRYVSYIINAYKNNDAGKFAHK